MNWIFYFSVAVTSLCEPNPCQNGGSCSVSQSTAVCECPQYTTGTYCESTILWTPTVPVLTEGVESAELVLRTIPHTSVDIIIATDPSISVLPSRHIVYEADDTEVTFTLTPTKSGFYSIDYVFTNFTTDFVPPSTTRFTVLPATPTTSIFDTYNITDSILRGGCCLSDARVHSSMCPLAGGQPVWLSSSCGWDSDYQTNGITFLYSADTVLPVSIVGIDSIPFTDRLSPDSQRSCSQCANSRPSDSCLLAEVTPTDIEEMVEQNSLFKTFVANIEPMLPSSVSVYIADTSTDPSTADSTSYHSTFITDKSGLMDYTSCQALELDVNGLMYIIRSTISGSIRIGDNVIVKNEVTEETCFAMDVCRLPQSPLHVSIPNSIQDTVVRAINTQFMIPQNVIQFVSSLSLSSYGTLRMSGEREFWNGESMVDVTVPTYDASIGLFAIKEIHNLQSSLTILRLAFHGSAYGKIDETVSECIHVKYIGVISHMKRHLCICYSSLVFFSSTVAKCTRTL